MDTPTPAPKGIKQLTELCVFLASALAVFAKEKSAFSLGNIGTTFLKVAPLAATAIPAFQGIGEIPAEIADLDPAEATVLVAQVQAAAGLESGTHGEQLLGELLKIIPIFANVVKVVKEMKAPPATGQ